MSTHHKKIRSLEYQVLYFSQLYGVNSNVKNLILLWGKISMIDWHLLFQTSIIIYCHRARTPLNTQFYRRSFKLLIHNYDKKSWYQKTVFCRREIEPITVYISYSISYFPFFSYITFSKKIIYQVIRLE